MLPETQKTVIQRVDIPDLDKKKVTLFIKREDLIHPLLSGNKFWKLKYNLADAVASGKSGILTFGGAYSNHIYAVAAAGKAAGLKVHLIIRGEMPRKLNPTLSFVKSQSATMEFVSRSEYRNKRMHEHQKAIKQKFPDYYIIPEGGTNRHAIKGVREMMMEVKDFYNFIACPVGTGGTLAGIILSGSRKSKILGFSVLKGNFLQDEISNWLSKFQFDRRQDWELIHDYHFGGYARFNGELVSFINQFQVPTDPIYSGKMFFGIMDMVKKEKIPQGSTILAIHTGGLQGVAGFNQRFGNLIDWRAHS